MSFANIPTTSKRCPERTCDAGVHQLSRWRSAEWQKGSKGAGWGEALANVRMPQ